jgi:P27 family predicted phage terminase small subunit
VEPPPVPVTLRGSGRERWAAVWSAPWLSPDLDVPVVQRVCELEDEIAEMRREIAEDGLTSVEPIASASGRVIGERKVPNGLLKSLRDAEKMSEAWLTSLGFTPTARARLGLAEVKARSALAELVARRAES